ncbi:hypothetical protein EVAR_54924_1 [Eumeta japonica]|uniref:Uncharacterized protein n=1 Tax=Eumeta variegata TaxID=151549 RepID=A0A4C1YA12_EUMVA|nr:hypothetical protein EVAR_54924_1 [Eumeta japonica]
MSQVHVLIQVCSCYMLCTKENAWVKLLSLNVGMLKFINDKAFRITPERPNVTYVNHDYLMSLNVTVRRHHRRSPYYTTVEIQNKQTWGNNVTVRSSSLHRIICRNCVAR